MTSNRPKRQLGVHKTIRRSVLAAALLAMALLALSGCGGSSKPAYCSDRANLQSSLKGLSDLNTSSGLSGLQAQLGKIHTAATSLVNSAKGDFPGETSAIHSSLDALTTTVKNAPSKPSASQLATIAKQSAAFVSSVDSFTKATSSKCG